MNHDKETAVLILCTVPDLTVAECIAKQLLSHQLAACVSVLPMMISFYQWQGQLQQERECQLIIKSQQHAQQAVFDLIKHAHPYELPELLVVPVLDGDVGYLAWIADSVVRR